jgi:hypothetical protein
MVGVVSQAQTANGARQCLQEAVELWFESCVERGVLDQALREANFRPSATDRAKTRTKSHVTKRLEQNSILGDPFEIHLTIPAYEAGTLLSATA